MRINLEKLPKSNFKLGWFLCSTFKAHTLLASVVGVSNDTESLSDKFHGATKLREQLSLGLQRRRKRLFTSPARQYNLSELVGRGFCEQKSKKYLK